MPILKSREGDELAKDLEGPSSELEEKSGKPSVENVSKECLMVWNVYLKKRSFS